MTGTVATKRVPSTVLVQEQAAGGAVGTRKMATAPSAATPPTSIWVSAPSDDAADVPVEASVRAQGGIPSGHQSHEEASATPTEAAAESSDAPAPPAAPLVPTEAALNAPTEAAAEEAPAVPRAAAPPVPSAPIALPAPAAPAAPGPAPCPTQAALLEAQQRLLEAQQRKLEAAAGLYAAKQKFEMVEAEVAELERRKKREAEETAAAPRAAELLPSACPGENLRPGTRVSLTFNLRHMIGWRRTANTLIITMIKQGSQADRAGVRPGWKIVALNGTPMPFEAFDQYQQMLKPMIGLGRDVHAEFTLEVGAHLGTRVGREREDRGGENERCDEANRVRVSQVLLSSGIALADDAHPRGPPPLEGRHRPRGGAAWDPQVHAG